MDFQDEAVKEAALIPYRAIKRTFKDVTVDILVMILRQSGIDLSTQMLAELSKLEDTRGKTINEEKWLKSYNWIQSSLKHQLTHSPLPAEESPSFFGWSTPTPILPKGNDALAVSRPAVAAHGGKIWCIWAEPSAQELYYSYNTTVTTMSDRKPFISNRNIVCAADSVALRDYHGSLHALAVNKSDSILHHYIYNDREEQWSEQQSFPEPVYSPQTAFTEYEGILYAALVVKNQLYWMTYAPTSLRWSGLSSVNEYSLGSVGIFSLDNSLYILFPEQNSHQILSLIYHSETQSWSRCEGERIPASAGATASDANGIAFIGYKDDKHRVTVSLFRGKKWTLNSTCVDDPSVAILDDFTYCFFDKDDSAGKRNIYWSHRPANFPYEIGNWMEVLPDDALLSVLSIPGTHDSATYGYQVPLMDRFVETQSIDIPSQLTMGIRFLDLRCSINAGTLVMVHGDIILSTTLETVLQQIYEWLGVHPTEGLIISLKEDPFNNSPSFGLIFLNIISKHQNLWRLDSTIPKLGAIRGKIQLFRRFLGIPGHPHTGIDASIGWIDVRISKTFLCARLTANLQNPEHPFVIDNGVSITIQDYYNLPSLTDGVKIKVNAVSQMLTIAATTQDPNILCINFASCIVYQQQGIIVPYGMAVSGSINNLLVDLLYLYPGKQRLGVVLLDYCGYPGSGALPMMIAQSNFV